MSIIEMKNGLELKIFIIKSDPLIYRTIRINSKISLSDLHWIIQDLFAWQNFHIHEFNIKGTVITSDREERIRLNQFIRGVGAKFHYTYDYVNSWIHEIVVIDTFRIDDDSTAVICMDGARNSPPEDSGGIKSYQEKLAILNDPSHPEYEWVLEWTDEFDPEYFDIRELNARLI